MLNSSNHITLLVNRLNDDLGEQAIKILNNEPDWTDGGEHCYKRTLTNCLNCLDSSKMIKFQVPTGKCHNCDTCMKNIYSGMECMRCELHDIDYCFKCYGINEWVSTGDWSITSCNLDVMYNIFKEGIGINKGSGLISQNENNFNGIKNNTTGHSVCPIVSKSQDITGNILIHEKYGLDPTTNPKGIHFSQKFNPDSDLKLRTSMVVYLFHGYQQIGCYFVKDVINKYLMENFDISKMQDINNLSKLVGLNIDIDELINKSVGDGIKAGIDGKKGSEGFFKIVFVPCCSVEFDIIFDTEEKLQNKIKSNINNVKDHISKDIEKYIKILTEIFERINLNCDIETKYPNHPYNNLINKQNQELNKEILNCYNCFYSLNNSLSISIQERDSSILVDNLKYENCTNFSFPVNIPNLCDFNNLNDEINSKFEIIFSEFELAFDSTEWIINIISNIKELNNFSNRIIKINSTFEDISNIVESKINPFENYSGNRSKIIKQNEVDKIIKYSSNLTSATSFFKSTTSDQSIISNIEFDESYDIYDMSFYDEPECYRGVNCCDGDPIYHITQVFDIESDRAKFLSNSDSKEIKKSDIPLYSAKVNIVDKGFVVDDKNSSNYVFDKYTIIGPSNHFGEKKIIKITPQLTEMEEYFNKFDELIKSGQSNTKVYNIIWDNIYKNLDILPIFPLCHSNKDKMTWSELNVAPLVINENYSDPQDPEIFEIMLQKLKLHLYQGNLSYITLVKITVNPEDKIRIKNPLISKNNSEESICICCHQKVTDMKVSELINPGYKCDHIIICNDCNKKGSITGVLNNCPMCREPKIDGFVNVKAIINLDKDGIEKYTLESF